jgi:hypothetical protein
LTAPAPDCLHTSEALFGRSRLASCYVVTPCVARATLSNFKLARQNKVSATSAPAPSYAAAGRV